MDSRRLIARISPLWLGIGISGSLLAIFVVTEAVAGRWELLVAGDDFDALARVSEGILRDVRIAIVHCLVIGYLPAAYLHVVRSGRRAVLVLQEALACTREECETLAASVRLSTRGLTITGLLGAASAFATPYLVPPVPPDLWVPSSWNAEVVWHRILGPLAMVGAAWLTYAVVTVSLRISRVAKRLERIDLLDLSSLTPFTQLGLSYSLVAIGLLSIWSLMLLEEGFGKLMWFMGGATLAVAMLALVAPVRGVHKRIVLAKETELCWANEAISKQRAVLQSAQAGRSGGEMADLVAYRGLIENVPEWPFTSSTYVRFFLYALLPLASWGIGVVAEEIVGRAFF